MSNILVKMPVKPHRQQVFWNKGGEEAAAPMKLQSWANKTAFAEGLVGEEALFIKIQPSASEYFLINK